MGLLGERADGGNRLGGEGWGASWRKKASTTWGKVWEGGRGGDGYG